MEVTVDKKDTICMKCSKWSTCHFLIKLVCFEVHNDKKLLVSACGEFEEYKTQ